jgi:hypothetical protein
MIVTHTKIIAGGVGLFTVMFVFAMTRIETPADRQTAPMHVIKQAVAEVVAQNVPSEAVKIWALKRAYQLNGNSMVREGSSIDLSNENPDAIVVQTEKVTPAPASVPVPATAEDEKQAAAEKVQVRVESNVCTRFGLRKVVTNEGKSWRCRR